MAVPYDVVNARGLGPGAFHRWSGDVGIRRSARSRCMHRSHNIDQVSSCRQGDWKSIVILVSMRQMMPSTLRVHRQKSERWRRQPRFNHRHLRTAGRCLRRFLHLHRAHSRNRQRSLRLATGPEVRQHAGLEV